MKVEAFFHNPKEMDVTLKVTMPLSEWQTLAKVLSEQGAGGVWPANIFHSEVRDMIQTVTQTFEHSEQE